MGELLSGTHCGLWAKYIFAVVPSHQFDEEAAQGRNREAEHTWAWRKDVDCSEGGGTVDQCPLEHVKESEFLLGWESKITELKTPTPLCSESEGKADTVLHFASWRILAPT